MSGRQNLRQEARRLVGEAVAIKQREREERDKRVAAHAVGVVTAIAERDRAIIAAERLAAAAIQQMAAEGLGVAEIASWCGGKVDAREVSRLSRLAQPDTEATP